MCFLCEPELHYRKIYEWVRYSVREITHGAKITQTFLSVKMSIVVNKIWCPIDVKEIENWISIFLNL